MAQIFGRQANWIARVGLISVPMLALLSIAVAEGIDRSSYVTELDQYPDQPVPFSHAHHVGDEGIDCRYCHTQVEKGAIAQIPPSEICMTCHSQIWSQSATLAPVRKSAQTGEALHWQRVTKLPDFVYFNHSIHVNKGVACVECHGPMQDMKLTRLEHPMQMQFCVDCHRDPSRRLRPRDQVTKTDLGSEDVSAPGSSSTSPPASRFETAEDRERLSQALAKEYDVHPKTDCIACHR